MAPAARLPAMTRHWGTPSRRGAGDSAALATVKAGPAGLAGAGEAEMLAKGGCARRARGRLDSSCFLE